jgi:hypothetical protein
VRARLLIVLVCAPFLFAGAWFVDAVIHDDPCLASSAQEGDGVRGVQRWLPPRTDCEIAGAAGTRVEPGETRWTQLTLFVLGMLALIALMSRMRLAARAAVLATTFLAGLATLYF